MATEAQSMQRLEAHVVGRVQGVGFRYFAAQRARRLGLQGWVRNERDGSVRLVAEGPREALDDLVRALNAGPPSARVEHVHTRRMEAAGEFEDFSTRFF
jgi:acylphosphatase